MFSLDMVRHDASLRLPATVGTDIAYVICTSGTTGRAKLVPIAHRRSAVFSKALGDWLELTAGDVGCHMVPFHHGHGLNAALMAPLLLGSSIVCLPESDVEAFYHALDAYRPTWLTAVFTIHKEILRRAAEYPDVVANHFRFFRWGPEHSIRTRSTSSSTVSRLSFPLIAGSLSGHDPSAACPQAWVCRSAVQRRGDTGRGGTMPPGETGEIVVRGPTVFGDTSTSEGNGSVFVDGWCRTGDLGRFDGDVLFMEGRVESHPSGRREVAPVQIDPPSRRLPGSARRRLGSPPTLGEEVAAAVVKEADDG
jgi:acyl-CoA synthetase (AMP-forming)/AMP-acid ligase II